MHTVPEHVFALLALRRNLASTRRWAGTSGNGRVNLPFRATDSRSHGSVLGIRGLDRRATATLGAALACA
jgi:hypothetical protein